MVRIVIFVFLFASTFSSYISAASTTAPTLAPHDDFNPNGTIARLVVARSTRSNETLEQRNQFRMRGHLNTSELTMVPLIPQHLIPLTRLFQDPDVMEFYEVGEVRTKEKHGKDAAEYVTGRFNAWIPRWETTPFSWWCLFSGKNFVGGFGCYLYPDGSNQGQIEIAYLIGKEYQRRRFVTQAWNLFLKYAVSRPNVFFTAFFAPVHPDNGPSVNFLSKQGFVHDCSRDKLGPTLGYKERRITMVLSKDYEKQQRVKEEIAPLLMEVLPNYKLFHGLVIFYLL